MNSTKMRIAFDSHPESLSYSAEAVTVIDMNTVEGGLREMQNDSRREILCDGGESGTLQKMRKDKQMHM